MLCNLHRKNLCRSFFLILKNLQNKRFLVKFAKFFIIANVIKSVAKNKPRDRYHFLSHKLGQHILNKAEGFGFASKKALFEKFGLRLVNFTWWVDQALSIKLCSHAVLRFKFYFTCCISDLLLKSDKIPKCNGLDFILYQKPNLLLCFFKMGISFPGFPIKEMITEAY